MKASYACLKGTRQSPPLTLRMHGFRLIDKSLIKVRFKFIKSIKCDKHNDNVEVCRYYIFNKEFLFIIQID